MINYEIRNLNDYSEKIEELDFKGFSVYRGQCCSSWLLEPGIIRKVKITYYGIGESGLLFSLSVNHVIELLKKARAHKHFTEEVCDLNVLAILQHYGAATPLLDFSYDPLVALYFACQPHNEKNDESDGKVFCINYSSQIRSHASPLHPVSEPSRINIESALNDSSRYIWYWTPSRDLCKRNEKQHSVFVFGWGLYWKDDTKKLIDELGILIIPAENKKCILKDLDERYDISEQTLFPDIYGFAQSNRFDKIIQHYSAKEFYDKGEELWRDGSPEWAAEYYKMAYVQKPEWINARCKCALSLNWNGEQDKALKVIEKSIREFGERWQYSACNAIINWQSGKEWKDDLKKAKEMANNENELIHFNDFMSDYESLMKE